MKLSEIKNALIQLTEITFKLPNGQTVPTHFHISEVGIISRHFIDCGGKVRKETKANFQLWEDGDFDHRLGGEKLKNIIELAERTLEMEDYEVEVEYQGETIGKYGIDFDGAAFQLTPTTTACLALDQCTPPTKKKKLNLSDLIINNNCSPGADCC